MAPVRLSLRAYLPRSQPSMQILYLFTALFIYGACAHGGHEDKIPEGSFISKDPIDATLWIHILLMIASFGIIFPTGMVLGMVKSKWHVPVQILGTIIAVLAYFLGHLHKGRQFTEGNIHAEFATSLMLMLVVQVALGIYLKLHLEKRRFGGSVHARFRPWIVQIHGWVGKLMPIVAWVQGVFGGTTAVGFCRNDHLGQCLAHFIMGGAFIGYGIVMTILLLVGQGWLRRTGRSQEFFDSLIIAAWGCVNTFTEHRWGTAWVGNDLQHTTMGIVWWCAGLLGVWLSRSRSGKPRRNLMPGIVVLMTGWAMSAHPQHLILSTMVHQVFGYTLMAAGATRIIEISFLLRDSRGAGEPNSFQHLPPFLLYASGFLFMGATEEQMQLLTDAEVTHVAYILILYSLAFLLYLFVNVLLHIFATYTWPGDDSNGLRENQSLSRSGSVAPGVRGPGHVKRLSSLAGGVNGNVNGGTRMPRHRVTDSQQVRDAEEFELEGLISDGEDSPVLKDAPKLGTVEEHV